MHNQFEDITYEYKQQQLSSVVASKHSKFIVNNRKENVHHKIIATIEYQLLRLLIDHLQVQIILTISYPIAYTRCCQGKLVSVPLTSLAYPDPLPTATSHQTGKQP